MFLYILKAMSTHILIVFFRLDIKHVSRYLLILLFQMSHLKEKTVQGRHLDFMSKNVGESTKSFYHQQKAIHPSKKYITRGIQNVRETK